MSFIWTRFSGLISYLKSQAQDAEKLKSQVAQVLSLLTCKKKSSRKEKKHGRISSELKDILTGIDIKIRKLYQALPDNAMFIVSTGHGDTAMVQG